MENKLTAVEWLYENLIFNPIGKEEVEYNEETLVRASIIGKEQIQKAWLCGQNDGATICTPNAYEPEEQYYSETYGKQDNG